jgi:hypothetical protein
MLHVKLYSPFGRAILHGSPGLLSPYRIQMLLDEIANLQIILGQAD